MTPAPSDIPHWVVQLTGPLWEKRSRHGHHVIDVVMLGQAGAQEHAPEVHVVGDVAARYYSPGSLHEGLLSAGWS
jgi:hypothetical protein